MFNIKGLKEELTSAQEALKELQIQMATTTEAIAKEREENAKRTKEYASAVKDLASHIEALRGFQDDVRDELKQFRALSKEVQRDLVQKTEKELGEVSNEVSRRLLSETEKFESLKRDVAKTAGELGKAQVKAQEFIAISSEIKKNDFAMSDYIKHVQRESDEKRKLEAEIEKLKSIMAKMKQRRH